MAKTISGLDKNINSVWGASRTITIGNKGKSVDGSGNVSWTLEEIGAATSGQIATTNSNVTALNSIINTNSSNIGKISDLQTTNKGSLVEAINEVFQSGNNVKQQLVDALIAYGIDCSTSDSWDKLISYIKPKESTFIIENNVLNSSYSFYNVSGTSGSSWKYSTTNGLYTNYNGGASYEYVTTNQKIDFSKINTIHVTAKCSSSSGHSTGFLLWSTGTLANGTGSNETSNAVKQTSISAIGPNYTTYTFDVSSWTGSYYLAISRNSYGSHQFYIKDIELVGEGGTLEDLLVEKDNYTTVNEELLLLDKGTEYNTNITGGIYTASGIALTSGTGLIVTPSSGAYKIFTFRNQINLSNYTDFEFTVTLAKGATEVTVFYDTAVKGGTYSTAIASTAQKILTFGNSASTGETKTYTVNFAEIAEMTGIDFNVTRYFGIAFNYPGSLNNYTITNMKFKNQRTYSNQLNVISATALPDTGVDNQICAITSNPVDKFIITGESTKASSDGAITLYTVDKVATASSNAITTIPHGNVISEYCFNKVLQGSAGTRLASYIYQSGTWNLLTEACIPIMEGGIYTSTNIISTFKTSGSAGNMNTITYKSGEGITFRFYTSTSYDNTYYLSSSNTTIDFSLYSKIKIKFTSACISGSYAFITPMFMKTSNSGVVIGASYSSANSTLSIQKDFGMSHTINYGTAVYEAEQDLSSWTGTGYLTIGFISDQAVSYAIVSEILLY